MPNQTHPNLVTFNYRPLNFQESLNHSFMQVYALPNNPLGKCVALRRLSITGQDSFRLFVGDNSDGNDDTSLHP